MPCNQQACEGDMVELAEEAEVIADADVHTGSPVVGLGQPTLSCDRAARPDFREKRPCGPPRRGPAPGGRFHGFQLSRFSPSVPPWVPTSGSALIAHQTTQQT